MGHSVSTFLSGASESLSPLAALNLVCLSFFDKEVGFRTTETRPSPFDNNGGLSQNENSVGENMDEFPGKSKIQFSGQVFVLARITLVSSFIPSILFGPTEL